jgi:hypothetical protein
MLQGALIGAVVGLVMAFMMVQQRRGLLKSVLGALAQSGPAAARTVLDGKVPQLQVVKLRDIDKQRQRMACLVLIGDVDAVEREVAQHTGDLTAITQVDAVAYLGLALRTDGERRARSIAALDAIATKMEQEGGMLMGVVKKKTRALAALGHGLLRQPIPLDQKLQVDTMAREKSSSGLIISQALGVSLAMLGRTDLAEPHLARVRSETSAFEPARG